MSVEGADKARPQVFTEESIGRIELILVGAAAIRQQPDEVMTRVTPSMLSGATGRLIQELRDSRKQNAMTGHLFDWFANHSIVLKSGEDLLGAIIRRLTEHREQEMLKSKALSLSHQMRHGSKAEVVEILKSLLVELGEMEPEKK